jgi:hypothetical protein
MKGTPTPAATPLALHSRSGRSGEDVVDELGGAYSGAGEAEGAHLERQEQERPRYPRRSRAGHDQAEGLVRQLPPGDRVYDDCLISSITTLSASHARTQGRL